ncbi:MAG: CBS domain-containing protein [Thaumarchaeota archaeon]|nr:CBS domain-containing protein [Nitrososphaerota archaeon]
MEVYERWVRGTLYVSDVMSKPVRTVPQSSPMPNAIRDMANHRIGCLVVTRKEEPVGIITEGDILRRGLAADLNLKTMKVGELMSAPLITITDDATIEAAASMMTAKGIRRLPVLKKGKLVGVITATDIIRKEPLLVRLLDELIKSKRKIG